MPGFYEGNPGVFFGVVVMIYAICRLGEMLITLGVERWEQHKAKN